MLSSLLSAGGAQALRLSPPLTRSVAVRRGLGLRASDGAILRTDHYAPAVGDAPTVLVRTPYGRGGLNAVAARMLAERGLHVVVSSCRGTGGSSGAFEPMRHERADGLDTVEWLRRQPWFNGRLGTFGPSYVGYTQWAIADVPELAAMATVVTASQFREPTYAGDSFSLFTTLAWASLLHTQAEPRWGNLVELLRGQPRLHRAFDRLPLGEADRAAIGAQVAFFRRWLELAGSPEEVADRYWDDLGHAHRVPRTSAAVLMVGGWHDIFLPWQLADYAALRAAGARTRLVVGAWAHGSGGLLAASVREAVEWMRLHLRGEGEDRRAPVRVRVEGSDQWRDLAEWPPPSDPAPWYLREGGRLATESPTEPGADRFTYDPADPTPTVGGPLLLSKLSGPRDNTALEARADVLHYSTAPLTVPMEIIGSVRATVRVRASSPYFDVFVRLCDVDPRGRSRNVSDGLRRVVPGRFPVDADGVLTVEVDLWPAAYRFGAGHRIRVQVSGGAHPRYARNPGTGEPLDRAVELRPVDIEVIREPGRATSVTLPVSRAG